MDHDIHLDVVTWITGNASWMTITAPCITGTAPWITTSTPWITRSPAAGGTHRSSYRGGVGWQELEAAHHARVDALLADHLARASRHEKHPVEDFLFTYYSHRPAQLRRWHPGAGVVLDGPAARERLAWRDYAEVDGGVALDVAGFLARRGDAVRRTHALLAATAGRPAQYGCFGLHEWAMVYRSTPEEVRHAGLPLRLGHAGTDAVVEASRLRCTHHDAFRFFTRDAVPRNATQVRREDQVALEQPGCLHATMDLYTWAYKLGPAVPGELLVDCFVLARDVRVLDMRASPYDVTSLGHTPVAVETAAGRAEYVEHQRRFAERGAALRARLLDVTTDLLAATVPA